MSTDLTDQELQRNITVQKLYIPSKLSICNVKIGLLFGWHDSLCNASCIVSVLPCSSEDDSVRFNKETARFSHLESFRARTHCLQSFKTGRWALLGILLNGELESECFHEYLAPLRDRLENDSCYVIEKDECNVIRVTFAERVITHISRTVKHSLLCIFYEPNDIIHNQILYSDIPLMPNDLRALKMIVDTFGASNRRPLKTETDTSDENKHGWIDLIDTSSLHYQNDFQRTSILRFQNPLSPMLSLSLTWCQFVHRFYQLKSIVNYRRSTFLCSGNTALLLAIDILSGIVMVWMISSFLAINQFRMAGGILKAAEVIVYLVQELLQWLMGIPAGLKLNIPLNYMLGKFFLYHMHLWKRYIVLLVKPYLPSLLYCIGMMGCGGVTFLLSMFGDLISLLTFHAYCFYIYAARLFYLMIFGLKSLFRLFRGKKWNVLRQRIDSCSYNMDQLFVGSILFTVILFLLPTVAMYYIVFTSLRLVVLTTQTLLIRLLTFINTCPIYAVMLWLLQSASIKGNVRYHILASPHDQNLWMKMELKPVCLGDLIGECHRQEIQPNFQGQGTTDSLLSSLIQGKIIVKLV